MFDRAIAIDWSGRSTPSPARPSADAIWMAEADEAGTVATYHRTRSLALDHLRARLARPGRAVVGIDIALGYPAGVAAALTGEPRAIAVWDWLADRIEDAPDNANNRFAVAAEMNRVLGVARPDGARADGAQPDGARPDGAQPDGGRPDGARADGARADGARADGSAPLASGPFWGWRASPDPDLPTGGRTARNAFGARATEARLRGAKSPFQLTGAGSVGSQSLLALPHLARLRRDIPLAVWPEETGWQAPDRGHVLVELYLSIWADAWGDDPIRDRAQVTDAAGRLLAATEDDFAAPGGLPDAARVATEEGWIWGVR